MSYTETVSDEVETEDEPTRSRTPSGRRAELNAATEGHDGR